MSDSVAYPVGNAARRDHLPGFTLLRSEILTYVNAAAVTNQDQIWPVDITLAQAMAIAWRVKKWKLTGTCSIAASASTPTGPASGIGSAVIDADVVLMNSDFVEATREREIVSGDMGAPWHALANSGANSINGQPFSTWSTLLNGSTLTNGVRNTSSSTQFTLANRATIFNPGTGNFCPQFDGPGFIIGNAPAVVGGSNAFASMQRHPVTTLSGSGPTSLLAPGLLTVVSHIEASFDVPLQLGWQFQFQTTGATFSGTGSLTLNLEAIEFWSHDGTYDTASGSQLLNPFR